MAWPAAPVRNPVPAQVDEERPGSLPAIQHLMECLPGAGHGAGHCAGEAPCARRRWEGVPGPAWLQTTSRK